MLDPKQALRAAVVAEWVMTMLSVVLSDVLQNSLPEPLSHWSQHTIEIEYPVFKNIFLFFSISVLILSITASVGLFKLKMWARSLYLTTVLIGYLLTFFLGPTIEPAITSTISDLSDLLSGIIIGLAFFSNVLCHTPQTPQHNT